MSAMTGMVVASCSSNAKLEYPEAPTDKTDRKSTRLNSSH